MNVALRQVLVALAQVPAEVQRPVAVNPRVGALDLIQHVAHLLCRHRRVRQEFEEFVEGALEVDVVFPERVVGIDDEKLAGHFRGLRQQAERDFEDRRRRPPARRCGEPARIAIWRAPPGRCGPAVRPGGAPRSLLPRVHPCESRRKGARFLPPVRPRPRPRTRGSTLRSGTGGADFAGRAFGSASRSANHTIQLPE